MIQQEVEEEEIIVEINNNHFKDEVYEDFIKKKTQFNKSYKEETRNFIQVFEEYVKDNNILPKKKIGGNYHMSNPLRTEFVINFEKITKLIQHEIIPDLNSSNNLNGFSGIGLIGKDYYVFFTKQIYTQFLQNNLKKCITSSVSIIQILDKLISIHIKECKRQCIYDKNGKYLQSMYPEVSDMVKNIFNIELSLISTGNKNNKVKGFLGIKLTTTCPDNCTNTITVN